MKSDSVIFACTDCGHKERVPDESVASRKRNFECENCKSVNPPKIVHEGYCDSIAGR
jgi:predicted RNA-binding Zn-ribbon protein involved in translation (DUF1610 family)